jgi:hypothetical protein
MPLQLKMCDAERNHRNRNYSETEESKRGDCERYLFSGKDTGSEDSRYDRPNHRRVNEDHAYNVDGNRSRERCHANGAMKIFDESFPTN